MATPTVQSSYSSADGTIYYDLTDKTGSSAEINGALFFQTKPDTSSGTGLIQAIVRVQDPGNGDGFENGYNTSFRPLSYEENTSPSFTTSLLLAEVPIVTINGTQFYEFRLDINQLSSSSLLSLDEIKLYSSAVGDGQAQGTIGGSWFTSHATLVYDMDGAGQSSVLLDANNSSGSGSSDMFFYVPVSNFGAVDPTDTYVTLYSEFGGANVLDGTDNLVARDDPANAFLNYNGSDAADNATAIQGTYLANDGFEEWSVSKQTGGIISGYKFNDLNGNGVWDNGEGGLAGWTFDYTISYDEGKGKNIQHVVVTGTATTSDGTMDVDGDGVIDPVGYYAIFVPASTDRHETYTITLTEEGKTGWVNTYDGDGTANGTTTFTFSGDDLTTTGTPKSPNISGHFGVTEEMNFGNFQPNPVITITKDASVPGGCADTVGELVTYTVTLHNTGNVTLQNVVLTDSFEGGSDATLTVTGDSNSNGKLDAGEVWLSGDTNSNGLMETTETWTYTYAHAVTQDDIDSNGGDNDGTLDNVATVNADGVVGGAAPEVSDDASVDVCQNPALDITKDADVPGGCADTVGELVTYTVTLENTGNVSLDNVVLKDSFEGGSDVTLTVTGDSNSNGVLDAGEVWLSGDTGNDGVMNPGETWTYTYAHAVTQSDINSNGGDNDGTLDNVATASAKAVTTGDSTGDVSDDASVDVCQNPALDITKDASVPGDCADTVGELVTYTVTLENTGNVDLNNVVLKDSFEGGSDVTLTVTGDSNSNGVLDAGEVWLSGDTGNDGVMSVGETWTYTYAHAVTQADIDSNGGDNDGTLDNVATASAKAVTTGDSTGDVSDDASVDVCQNPALSITKDASVPGDCADTAGENITYTVTLENTGNVALDHVVLTDSFEGGSGVTITPTGDSNSNGTLDPGEVWLSGDTGNDGIMSVGETWTYTYLHTVTQAEINSNGVDGDASLDNVATANAKAVNSGTAADTVSDDAHVDVCQNPGVDLTKYVDVDPTTVPPLASDAHWDDANSALGPQDVNLGTDVWFKVTVENTGNVDLTNVDIVDVNKTLGLPGVSFDLMQNGALTADAVNNHGAVLTGDTDSDGVLDVGETWTIIYSQAFDPGDHFNTATVTDDQNVTDSDDAHYYSLINLGPCPRTPGFWQNMNNGGLFWDNISGNEKHIGEHDFPSGELIYPVDSNHDGVINGSDQVGLLIGDYNHDGLTDNGEDTLFISYADARTLINANNKQMGDGKFMLGRDMVAVWLNFLAGVSIGDASDTQSPKHYLNDAINWMQIYAGNTSGGNSETFDSFKLAGAIKPSSPIYNTVQAGFDHSASQMHTALDYFDNTGQTQPGGTIYANCDSNDFLQAVTLYETTHNVLV